MRWLHAVRLAPRPGLPLGLLLVTVYAPQQAKELAVLRQQFAAAFLDFIHCVDMQMPVLLLGDFNGTVDPPRDYQGASGARRLACPLLVRLLGPGGPFIDAQVALHGEALDWTYRNADSSGRTVATTSIWCWSTGRRCSLYSPCR